MKSLIDVSIRQPITVAVGVILILLAGTIAFSRVPVQMAPSVESVVISVTTHWENASPQEIETEIVDEQEQWLQGVSGLVSMTSVSQAGQGQIRLEFRTGTDINDAMAEVDQKISQVPEYPEEVDQPEIEGTDPESVDYIAWVGLSSSDPKFDAMTLYDFMNNRVKPIFERIPGISEVGIVGAREKEVQIHVDPLAMADRGITIRELLNAIQRSNKNFSGGSLPDGKNDIRIRVLGRFYDVEQAGNLVIRRDEAGPVYLREIAEVVETYKEPTNFVRARGHIMPFMNFQLEIGANLLETMHELQAKIDELNKPGGLLETHARELGMNGTLELVQTYDSTKYVHQALKLVQSNFVVGGILAILTLLLFLRSLKTIGIIALAIPISVIGSIIILTMTGRTVNIISLAGMAFSVGMVVDNAIVVIENIFRHLEMGKNARQAALEGAQEVSGAVLASTATTLVVFLPILLVQESAGQLFRDIVIAIGAAVGLSLFVSLLVIPACAAKFLHQGETIAPPKTGGRESALTRILNRTSTLLEGLPEKLGNFAYYLTGTWKRRMIVIVSFTFVTFAGIALLIPKLDYLPAGNRNVIFGMLIPPPGYNFEKLQEIGKRLEEQVRPAFEVSKPKFKIESVERDPSQIKDRRKRVPIPEQPGKTVLPPPIGHYFVVGWSGQVFHVAIVDDEKRVADALALFKDSIQGDVAPDIFGFAFQFPLFRTGGRSGSAIKVDIVGDNLDEITGVASKMMFGMMEKFGPGQIQPEPANFLLPTPESQIIPRDERLQELGMNREDAGYAVQAASDGLYVGKYQIAGELKDLKVISKDAFRANPVDSLNNILIATPGGSVVDLASVADVHRVNQQQRIKRVNRQRAITLQLTPPPGMPLGQAVDMVNELVDGLKQAGQIPPSVRIQQAGSAGKLTEFKEAILGDGSFVGTISSSMFLALVVVYLTMVVLFQSWIYPFVIMLSVPLATFGGFLGLAIVHNWSLWDRYLPVQNLDVLTMLGFMILIGVVVNNAILIVHQALNFLAEKPSLDPREAIRESVSSRVRPILMSTLTSVGGMMPLILMPGSGSELYRGLGSVVVGGLMVSTIFTLFLVPVVLSIAFDVRRKTVEIVSSELKAPQTPEENSIRSN